MYWQISLTLILASITLSQSLPSAATKSGPFESMIVRAEKCAKPTLPLDKNPPVVLYAELYNATNKVNLIRGNVTILRDCKNKKIRSKAFHWEQGKWKLVYLISNMGCSSVFMPLMALATRVKYDLKNCIYFKGKYTFDNVDTNKLQHVLSSVQEYGRILWRNEFFTEAGSVFCWEFETLVAPAGQLNLQ